MWPVWQQHINAPGIGRGAGCRRRRRRLQLLLLRHAGAASPCARAGSTSSPVRPAWGAEVSQEERASVWGCTSALLEWVEP